MYLIHIPDLVAFGFGARTLPIGLVDTLRNGGGPGVIEMPIARRFIGRTWARKERCGQPVVERQHQVLLCLFKIHGNEFFHFVRVLIGKVF